MHWPLLGKKNKSQAKGQTWRSGVSRQSPGLVGTREVSSRAPRTLATPYSPALPGTALGGAATAVSTAGRLGASSLRRRGAPTVVQP